MNRSKLGKEVGGRCVSLTERTYQGTEIRGCGTVEDLDKVQMDWSVE